MESIEQDFVRLATEAIGNGLGRVLDQFLGPCRQG